MKRFCKFTHFYATSFSMKTCFYEPINVFVSRTRHIFTKLSIDSESSIKIKIMPHWTLLVILLTSAVTRKQRLLHANEIVQYLQN